MSQHPAWLSSVSMIGLSELERATWGGAKMCMRKARNDKVKLKAKTELRVLESHVHASIFEEVLQRQLAARRWPRQETWGSLPVLCT